MDRPLTYCIRTQEHLQRRLLVNFELQDVIHTENGETEISGRFDQAALRGLLTFLGDLGIVLIAVNLVDMEEKPTRGESA